MSGGLVPEVAQSVSCVQCRPFFFFFFFFLVVVFFVVVVKWMFTCERVKTSHISWCVRVPAQSGPKEKLSLV